MIIHFFVVSVLANLVLAALLVATLRAKARAETKAARMAERIRRTTKDRDELRATLIFTEQELEKEQEDNERLTICYSLAMLNVNKRLDIAPPTVAMMNQYLIKV